MESVETLIGFFAMLVALTALVLLIIFKTQKNERSDKHPNLRVNQKRKETKSSTKVIKDKASYKNKPYKSKKKKRKPKVKKNEITN